MSRALPGDGCPLRARQGPDDRQRTGLVSLHRTQWPHRTLDYDRLVLATGSTGFRPNIPGLAEHAFGVEQIDEAIKLDEHIHALAKRPAFEGAQHRGRRRRRLHRDRDRDRDAAAAARHPRPRCQTSGS